MIPRGGGNGQAMPNHDPLPPLPEAKRDSQADYERAAAAWARYKRGMRGMTIAALGIAALSVAWLARSGESPPWYFLVTAFAGIALVVLVGTGLMGLVFLSNRSGHDEEAGR